MTTAISPQLALYPGHSRAAWLALQGSWAFNKTTFNNRRQAFQPTMACGFHGACGSGSRSMGYHGLLAAASARRRWRALDGSVGKNYPTRRPSTLDIKVLGMLAPHRPRAVRGARCSLTAGLCCMLRARRYARRRVCAPSAARTGIWSMAASLHMACQSM